MADDAGFIWDEPARQTARRRPPSQLDSTIESLENRITLREAERRFGVRVSTLRAWSRRGAIDGVRTPGPHGEQWMVTTESVAHHLSRRAPRATPTDAPRATGPTKDGNAMLVPRDAWDRLMDQLGNLHEAGMNLAEARERAARAETESTFLRERLAEMRSERDELKDEVRSSRGDSAATPTPSPGVWETFRRRYGWLWGNRR